MSDSQDGVKLKAEGSRALVPVAREAGARAGCVRPLAAFVTQVLACHERMPEFRQHRRASSPDAAARYGTAPVPQRASRLERVL